MRKLNLTSSQAPGWDVSTVPTNLGCQMTDLCSSSSGEAWRLCVPLLSRPELGSLVLSDRASLQIQSCCLKEERRIVSVSLASVYTRCCVMWITSPTLSIRSQEKQINEKEMIECRLIYHYPTYSVYSIQIKEQFIFLLYMHPINFYWINALYNHSDSNVFNRFTKTNCSDRWLFLHPTIFCSCSRTQNKIFCGMIKLLFSIKWTCFNGWLATFLKSVPHTLTSSKAHWLLHYSILATFIWSKIQ